ncbi:MAG: polysaccharide biosynthesis C-terminal domain-containing protein [Anaerolineae bacterium]|nr:polysaccharide biosynthesis C-terminal domain-containing protein [Anaerolineae bacterium]
MQREDYQATFVVMVGLAAATLTGFLRQAAIAHQLGAGRLADIYLVAFAVPEFVFIALPIVLPPAFIPLFAASRKQQGEAVAWHFALRVAGALLVALLAVTIVAGVGAPLYLRWLAPGFAPAERAQAAWALYRMLPAICLMGLSTLAGAVLQVYRRFARPALATAVYNLTFVGVLLSVPLATPLGRAAWGVTLGAAAALVFQMTLMAGWVRPAAGENFLPVYDDSQVKQVARLMGPLAAGYAVHHLILFVDRALATTLGEGSAAALSYAYHLALVVGQLSGLAVSTALFPRLAEQVADGDLSGARASLAGALRFAWAVGLPATAALVILRVPLVQVLLERGAFGAAATIAVSRALPWYALAVLADALCQPLWRAIYAQRGAWTVLAVNSMQTGLRLAGNLVLMSAFGYNGLALSAAIGLTGQAIVLGLLVRRRLGSYLTGDWWRGALSAMLAAAVAAGVGQMLLPWLAMLPVLVRLLAAGLIVGASYLLTLGALSLLYRNRLWKRSDHC